MRINVFYEESLIVQNLLQKGFDPMSCPSNFAPGRRMANRQVLICGLLVSYTMHGEKDKFGFE